MKKLINLSHKKFKKIFWTKNLNKIKILLKLIKTSCKKVKIIELFFIYYLLNNSYFLFLKKIYRINFKKKNLFI